MSLERVAAGALAGAVAGVLCGIAARVAMRSVALGLVDASMQVPTFTVPGTLGILTIAAIVGAPFGVGYALMPAHLGRTRLVRGLLYAGVMILAFGPLFFLGTEEFFSTGRVLAFIWLFPIFGIGAALALPAAQRLAGALPAYAQGALAAGAAGGAGLIAVGLLSLAGQSFEKNGPIALGLFATWPVLAVAGALALRWRPALLRTELR